MSGFINYFSLEYYLSLVFFYFIFLFFALGGEKEMNSDNPYSFHFEDFGMFFAAPALNALLLLVFAFLTVVWGIFFDTKIGIEYQDSLWSLIRWITSLLVIFSFFLRIKRYKSWIQRQKDELNLQLNKIKEIKSSILKIAQKTIDKAVKLENVSIPKYENKISSYKKNYSKLIDTITTEETTLSKIALEHPRISDLIKERGIGDSNKFLEKQDLIFAETSIANYENNLKDFNNHSFFKSLKDSLTKYKDLFK